MGLITKPTNLTVLPHPLKLAATLFSLGIIHINDEDSPNSPIIDSVFKDHIFLSFVIFFWLFLTLGSSALSCLKGDRNSLSAFSLH